ncbi:MAG: helix-turn-helix transcriptional regulator [Clostridia bacterium]|nr:helix-turn-helix transcriptional regulator [Clostridia bacterium]
MDFNKKLQELRKQRGLTQEELAEHLFVSRAAVSKWESGRGYPGIDSLKTIASFFEITIDELLNGEELLTAAEEDTKQKEKHFRDLVFGLLDCSVILIFFLPLFGQMKDGRIDTVSLFALNGIQTWLRILYYTVTFGTVVTGVMTLVLQCFTCPGRTETKPGVSISLSITGVFLFIISRQPYAAVLIFVFMIIKVLMLTKKR